jgi:hypothetical protein
VPVLERQLEGDGRFADAVVLYGVNIHQLDADAPPHPINQLGGGARAAAIPEDIVFAGDAQQAFAGQHPLLDGVDPLVKLCLDRRGYDIVRNLLRLHHDGTGGSVYRRHGDGDGGCGQQNHQECPDQVECPASRD